MSQLMEKQRLARSGTVNVAPAVAGSTNGHSGGRGHNNRSDQSSKTNGGESGLNEMPHSLRRVSTGGSGFIRLEPRPSPAAITTTTISHSTNSNIATASTVSQVTTTTDLTTLYGTSDGLQVLQMATDQQNQQQSTFLLTRDGSSPTASSSSSSSSSSSFINGGGGNATDGQLVHLELLELPSSNGQDHLVAKQESIDIDFTFYSTNCQSSTPATSTSNITSPMNFTTSDNSPALPFPPFYSMTNGSNANNPHVDNDMRPSDELLSDHSGYRLDQYF